MPKQLTVHNATITTAAVEVKTLTISGKQVTLAVFRQLREEPLIAEDGTLNGVPWGIVNYHPDKCGDSYSHWHVVWQSGTELLRSRVDETPPFDPDGFQRMRPSRACLESADRLLTASVQEWIAGRSDEAPLFRTNPQNDFEAMQLLSTPYEFHVQATASKAAVDAANKKGSTERRLFRLAQAREEMTKPHTPYTKQEWREQELNHARRAVDEGNAELAEASAVLAAELAVWGASYADLTAEYVTAIKTEAERRQRHRDIRQALSELPQLFIAV